MEVTPTTVNVSDSVALGGTMTTGFRNALPTGFHANFSSPVNTMEHLQRVVRIGDKVAFDLVYIFRGRSTARDGTPAYI